MRRVGLFIAATFLAATSGPTTVLPAPSREPLPQRLSALASGYCAQVLDGTVSLPAPGVANVAFLERYGLVEGMPPEAMKTLGASGDTLIAGATLASGSAVDGAFVVALGGDAGGTCRLIVYKAPLDRLAVVQTVGLLRSASFGWKALPPPPQSPAAISIRSFRRGKVGLPLLASLIAPVAEGPVALMLTVATIPPDVKLPEGY